VVGFFKLATKVAAAVTRVEGMEWDRTGGDHVIWVMPLSFNLAFWPATELLLICSCDGEKEDEEEVWEAEAARSWPGVTGERNNGGVLAVVAVFPRHRGTGVI
jgi:hypothetical protein